MLVKFKRDWRRFKEGMKRDIPDGQANLMIRRLIVEPVLQKKKTKARQNSGT